ncbi:hypothetical protein PoB_002810600 [Plakobranchus ocellatus]|uniref:Uncharacterized protein n=1 Tax=Plakobranchus ocellatus TaxID=259542 RepID=A0AAV3ZRB5_9GAST|nr:hypothetical protein PoB_002810600 [Plakobranchus ocellatus]
MLSVQFLAMLFHRYSTLLHVVAVTKVKVSKFASLLRFHPEDADEGSPPSVKETIDLVRAMQSLRPPEATQDALAADEVLPEIPEEDYPTDDTEVMARRRSSIVMWGKIDARSRAVTKPPQTLSRAFMKNYSKLANQMRRSSRGEITPDQVRKSS